tara:strand:+ start:855 stop:1067 length:213 start_codon:yes stop_codon:yes gene_type:complete
MKYLFYIFILNLALISNLSSEEKKCKDLVDKPIEWSKCVKDKSIDLGKKGSKKLNTDSKLTDWVKKKIGK